jgi:glycosyltransferase involved in cell wall biosynthesis
MNNQPLVSIIIPTYRRWDFLCDAIRSVLLQSYQNWEVVIVNDDPGNSPQGLVAELLRNPRIIYVSHDMNKGLAAARNTGIAMSSGTYLAYLDDDDIFYPNHLESVLNPLLHNNWHVAYADAYESTYEIDGSIRRIINKKLVCHGPFLLQKMWQNNCIPVLSVIHHRECIEKTGNFDIKLPVLEDWDFWLRMLCNYQFYYIPKITSEYRKWQSNENMMQRTSKDKWNITHLQIYQKSVSSPQIIENKFIKDLLQKAIYRFIRRNMEWLVADLNVTNHRELIDGVLSHVSYKDWIGLFLNKPLLARQVAHWHIKNRVQKYISSMSVS